MMADIYKHLIIASSIKDGGMIVTEDKLILINSGLAHTTLLILTSSSVRYTFVLSKIK